MKICTKLSSGLLATGLVVRTLFSRYLSHVYSATHLVLRHKLAIQSLLSLQRPFFLYRQITVGDCGHLLRNPFREVVETKVS